MRGLKDAITQEGQDYWDEPKYVLPKRDLGAAVAYAFGTPLPKPILTHHERVKLNWKKPVFDKNGKCIGTVDK